MTPAHPPQPLLPTLPTLPAVEDAVSSAHELAWVLEGTPEGAFVHVAVSRSLLAWAGAREEAFLGRPAGGWLPPETAGPYLAELEQTRRNRSRRSTVLRSTIAGHEVVLEIDVEPLAPSGDGADRLLCRARDVTVAHAALAALAALRRRAEETYGDVRIGVAVVDVDGRVQWANAALDRMLGLGPCALEGRLFTSLVHPDDRQSDGPLPLLRSVEVRLVRADGQLLHARLTSSISDVGGDRPHMLLQVEDVSAVRAAEERLRAREDRFRSLAVAAPVGILFSDVDGRLLSCNRRLSEITGLAEGDLLGRGWLDAMHPDDRDSMVDALVHVAAVGELSLQCRVRRPDGDVRWVQVRLATVEADDGTVTELVATLEDVTLRVWSERALLEREAEYRLLASMSTDLITRHAPDGTLVYASPASEALLGVEPTALLGTRFFELVHPDDVPQVRVDARHLDVREQATLTFRVRRADGAYVWVEARARNLYDDVTRERVQVLAVTRDITEHKRSEALLARQALTDPLTGLPNRALLMDRISQAVARLQPGGPNVAVLFLDLDNFKVVNDSLGHEAGDRLLVAVADRLAGLAGAQRTVARFGGDEFVVLCTDVEGEPDVLALADLLATGFARPFDEIDGGELFATCSIGIAIACGGEVTAETLIRDADAAMYRAKERGGARYEVFNERLRSRVVDRMETANALHGALERGEFRLHYQPIVDIATGMQSGVEALLRWEHPVRGLVLPCDFVPIAEATGLVTRIGAWVLEEACRQLALWGRDGGPVPTVAVNLSARQLVSTSIVDSVADALASTGVDPHLLCLEVTESSVMDDPEASIALLRELRALGVSIAVDDFGTGYSSLSYLKRLPVDRLKVDRSFVSGLGEELEDTAIVAAVVNLAHILGMRAVAEGVESERQLDELRGLGCDFAQGFLFARPLAADRILRPVPSPAR